MWAFIAFYTVILIVLVLLLLGRLNPAGQAILGILLLNWLVVILFPLPFYILVLTILFQMLMLGAVLGTTHRYAAGLAGLLIVAFVAFFTVDVAVTLSFLLPVILIMTSAINVKRPDPFTFGAKLAEATPDPDPNQDPDPDAVVPQDAVAPKKVSHQKITSKKVSSKKIRKC